MNIDAGNEMIKVTFEPIGRTIKVLKNTTVLNAAQQGGIEVIATCGGNGTCGRCKFIPISGEFSQTAATEKSKVSRSSFNQETRLACLTKINSDCTVFFPADSLATLQRIQLEGVQNNDAIDPIIRRIDLEIKSPGESKKEIPEDQILKVIKQECPIKKIPSMLIPLLNQVIQESGGKFSIAVSNEEIIAVLRPGQNLVGLALDIGTTKIAGYLVNLETGQTISSGGVLNPQIAYGEDVISRIKYADENLSGANLLQKIVVQGINDLINDLCCQGKVVPNQIIDCVIVGNTVMHHLLTGLPVHSLGTAPYQPSMVNSLSILARTIGISISDNAYVYLPPNIAGFIGGDHVSVLVATNAPEKQKAVLIIDVGTNTEISLIVGNRHFACSCASGPAFEGAHIQYGLRAIPGAIEGVFIENDVINVQTIENKPAIGICGSGILDLVAELRKEEIINKRGAFNKSDPHLRQVDGNYEFVIVHSQHSGNNKDITINRKDIHEIQLAKAAIRSGIEVLLKCAQILPEDVDLVLLAGAFGTYLDIESAINIGMLPLLPLNHIQQVGNAAGSGACRMLLSSEIRRQAEQLHKEIEYIELTTTKGYTDIFLDAIGFE